MIKVTSTLPGEGTVDYKYGGDGKRRERDDGTNFTWYNWDVGYNVINEEDEGAGLGNGTLAKTYIKQLGDVAGSNPATGDYRYYMHDNIRSTRGVYDQSKNSLGEFEYTPFGEGYSTTGPSGITHRYTGSIIHIVILGKILLKILVDVVYKINI